MAEVDAMVKPKFRAEELKPYRSLDADRLRLHGRAQWDPGPCLPDSLWMASQEPDSLLWTMDVDECDDLPNLEKEETAEILKLARVWDVNGLLSIRRSSSPAETLVHEGLQQLQGSKL